MPAKLLLELPLVLIEAAQGASGSDRDVFLHCFIFNFYILMNNSEQSVKLFTKAPL